MKTGKKSFIGKRPFRCECVAVERIKGSLSAAKLRKED